MRRLPLLLLSAFVLVSTSQSNAQILHKKKKTNKSTDATNTAEPDKQLYDKAMNDIKHGRHEVGRLGLQTLINTYPDSEYLAKAKLAIADSYFKEGGTANTTQAVAGYKDFIVFFPFLPEAAYAQMQVAMANYNEMAKSDRDSTHAKLAEEEFQTFLQKYPKDPLGPKAEQRLREVQEVLAEGQFRIAYYYYVKGDRRAAAGRLAPLVGRYPLYSKSDEALWMLGDVFEKSERKDVAGAYYTMLVKNYPLSKKAPLAKDKLKAYGVPIPQPDAKALAWMTAEQNAPRPKETPAHRAMGMLHSGPDVHTTAQSGRPQMEPEADNGPTETLGGGNRTTLVGGGGGGAASSSPAVVDTVRPGDPKPAGAEDTTSGAGDSGAATNADGTAANATDAAAPADAAKTDAATTADPAKTDATATDTAATDATKTAAPAAADANTNQKESSSKKKGLKKLIPW
ncbi:MAG TPA: outer membrane protein assembly factor BamD [Candidatus Baltobacteraceae bacterium]|nr:outer membrane protein assembly factor BamD [Candidatus Baltobacteraceae bacterium]